MPEVREALYRRRIGAQAEDGAVGDALIPRVDAFGRKAPSPSLNSDRGGAIRSRLQYPRARPALIQSYAKISVCGLATIQS